MPNLVATVADTDDHGMSLRLREDTVSETNEREANMHNAPAKDRGLFLVPKVIE
jgi:aspartyl-tRNA(Asn)/glutamyl-tRNA(Gln) amidotransferase subunit C